MSTPVVRDVYVATILRPEGETGVQTHCRMFLGAAREVGWGVRLITPFDMGPAVVYPSFAVGRLAKPFHKGFWVWWYRRLHYTLLRQALVRALAPGAPAWSTHRTRSRHGPHWTRVSGVCRSRSC